MGLTEKELERIERIGKEVILEKLGDRLAPCIEQKRPMRGEEAEEIAREIGRRIIDESIREGMVKKKVDEVERLTTLQESEKRESNR